MAQHGVIYIINNNIRDGEERFKVGRTYDLERRLTELNGETSNFGKFKTLASFPVSDMVKAESEVHKALEQFRIDNKEFFEGKQDEIINIVQSITSKYKPEDFIPIVQKYTEKNKSWLLLAEQGDATAQFKLGLIYSNGKGVPQDYNKAVKWYHLSAKQGDALAQSNLGVMYQKGQGVRKKNHEEAVKWFCLSREQGYVATQSQLEIKASDGKKMGTNEEVFEINE